MIAVHDLGGEGEPLLVCHANGFCGRMYQPLARTLGARHHVFARKRTEVFSSRVDARERFRARASLASLHDEVLDCYVKYKLEDLPDGTVRIAHSAR